MTTFDSTKFALSKLLEQVSEGKIQLPDFQRGRIWDDAHIRSLLVSNDHIHILSSPQMKRYQ